MESFEKKLNLKYDGDDEIFEICLKKIVKKDEEMLNISLENEDNEVWEYTGNTTNLIDIDPIFKKFTDILDIIDIFHENFSERVVKIEKSGDKCYLTFKVKFVKNESCPRFALNKTFCNEENPTIACFKTLKKEIELLKMKKKIPVISFVGALAGNNSTTGDLILKTNQSVTFHLFIDYRLIYSTNAEEFLYFNIKNEQSKEEYKERLVYKTWHGCYQGGSGYQDSKAVSFMFIEKLNRGENKITLRKQGGSQIYTLYLTAEL